MYDLWGGYVMNYFWKKKVKKKLKKRTTIGSSGNFEKFWDPPLNFLGDLGKKKLKKSFFFGLMTNYEYLWIMHNYEYLWYFQEY